MSKWDCVKCKRDAEGERVWMGAEGHRICRACTAELAQKAAELLNIDGPTSDEYGITLHWHEIVALLERSSYIVPVVAEYPFFYTPEARVQGASNERIAVRLWTDRSKNHGEGSEEGIKEELKRALSAEGFSCEGVEKERRADLRADAYFAWGLRQ